MKSLKTLLERLAQSSRLTVREKTHMTQRTRGGKLIAKAKGDNSPITQYQNNGGTLNVNSQPAVVQVPLKGEQIKLWFEAQPNIGYIPFDLKFRMKNNTDFFKDREKLYAAFKDWALHSDAAADSVEWYDKFEELKAIYMKDLSFYFDC